MQNAIFRFIFSTIFALLFCLQSNAQGALTFDLKKPEKFENKKLGSEKTGEKKFTVPRRFIQNTVTHYNWYFNAKNNLDEIIERAKAAHVDDYNSLLPFYNLSVENTRRDKSELDSIIYKTTAGILIHDLRNDWIDNLYLLMGKAYYYKGELDSAYLTFQYINYAFAPKESGGYDIPIGSNATEGNNAFSISTREKRNLAKKILSEPPSRNESLVWQIRTYIENNELPEAAGLIETLRHDPNFPERLNTELSELQAWWFYKQEVFDSAAIHLEDALPHAANKQEIARWEYLIAQLYERTGHHDLAQEFYGRAIQHTLNPVMEVYARLNSIRQNKGDSVAIQKNILELLKMARKDRYSSYRDIIYYTAAQIELERNNETAAKQWLIRSTAATSPTSAAGLRTRAFLQLGDLSYAERNYRDAQRYYDSVNNTDPGIPDPLAFESKRTTLGSIRDQLNIIARQDSLQRIAGLPDGEREAFLKKMVKQLRKSQGLKEDEKSVGTTFVNQKNEPEDLFKTEVKGEWYFYNPSLKAKGYADFKNKWGNRPNTDNWRRSSVATQASNQPEGLNKENMALKPAILATDLSYEGLLKRLPLQPEQLAASNDSIEAAMFALGKLYMDGLEAYPAAIEIFKTFLDKFPYSSRRPDVLFQLYYAYKKTGEEESAISLRKEMEQKYPESKFNGLIARSLNGNTPDSSNSDMQARYETVYNSFIEGNFEKAMAEKHTADSLYSNNYWTPQLLYIQAIYQIRQRIDDSAKNTLKQISSLYPESALAAKAKTMLDVLDRRKEIEAYLTQLKIERPGEDSLQLADTTTVRAQNPAQPVITKVPVQLPGKKTDSVQRTGNRPGAPQDNPAVPPKAVYGFSAEIPHYVVVVLDKVDPVYVSESRNAFNRYNKEKYYNRPIDISNQVIDENNKLVVMAGFENATVALDYLEKTRKAAASEIIPWLPASKYSFIIISAPNLEILKTNKDLDVYRKFLSVHFPGKF
ncbi:MAG TPA: hypothetical protein VM012_06070 [Flavitalea sp.]|nr:hypothetical protein [Flavitalea sp.]